MRNDFEKWLTAADEKASKIGAWAIVNMEKVVRNGIDCGLEDAPEDIYMRCRNGQGYEETASEAEGFV